MMNTGSLNFPDDLTTECSCLEKLSLEMVKKLKCKLEMMRQSNVIFASLEYLWWHCQSTFLVKKKITPLQCFWQATQRWTPWFLTDKGRLGSRRGGTQPLLPGP